MTIIPDAGIQKVFISKTLLPEITKDGKYSLRYRITSSDGTQVSSWSPKYTMSKNTISEILTKQEAETQYSIKSQGASIDVGWKFVDTTTKENKVVPPLDGLNFDVYIMWGSTPDFSPVAWGYAGTTSSGTVTIPIPEIFKASGLETHYFRLMVHLSTTVKDVLETNLQTLLIYEDTPISTQAIYGSDSNL